MESGFNFFIYANESIDCALIEMQKLAETDSQLSNMGSTVVALAVCHDNVNLVNVGDSHAYLIREGKINQINYDHSFVGEAVRAGLITKEEASNHPKKNQLTQSINARKIACKPYFASFPIKNGDLLLLCSDGLWGVVPEEMIQTIISELPPQQAADKLVTLANSRGGPDNISIIICKRNDSNQLTSKNGNLAKNSEKNKWWSFFKKASREK